jgi:nucleotide-binding universal stress UspA family protein
VSIICIAVDGSESSAKAGRTAARLFPNAELLAVNISPPDAPWTSTYPWGAVGSWPLGDPDTAVEHADRDEAIASTGTVPDEIPAHHGIEPDQDSSTEADPAPTVLEAARGHRADIIVVGYTDDDWLVSLLRDAGTDHGVRQAGTPVLVVS